MTDLGETGIEGLSAVGINERNQIIGESCFISGVATPGATQAVLWTLRHGT